MNHVSVALFAAGDFGLGICRILADRGVHPQLLVVDPAGDGGWNAQISQVFDDGDVTELSIDALGDTSTLALIESMDLDLGLLAWWPYIVREDVLRLFSVGVLNFHPSLLPWGRGKDPNFWAIVDRSPFGATIHHVDRGIDTGDIAFQREIEVGWEDTGRTLYSRARDLLFDLFAENVDRILKGDLPRTAQDPRSGTFHKRGELDPRSELVLDQTYQARDLLDLMRARTFPPHPGAWFMDEGRRYEVRIEIRET